MYDYSDDQIEAAAMAALGALTPPGGIGQIDFPLLSRFLREGVSILQAKPIVLSDTADKMLRVLADLKGLGYIGISGARQELQRKGLLRPESSYKLSGNRRAWTITALGRKYLKETPAPAVSL